MFFTNDNQTLYLTTFNYNVALILGELKKIILDNGGTVKEQRHGEIINRSFFEAAREEEKRAEGIRHYIELRTANGATLDPEKTQKFNDNIQRHLDTIKDLETKAEESRRPAENLNYIIFTYDGNYYNLCIKDLELGFDFRKTPINNGKYSRDVYAEDLSSRWFIDDFCKLYSKPGIDADRREAANLIFNELVNAAPGKKYRDGTRRRVPNLYNNGYHYETIYRPERLGEIDF